LIKHRENIKEAIISEIQKAKKNIIVAVCWFTDVDLYKALLAKSKEGIKVEILITNDHTNVGKNKINWYSFLDYNGKVYLYKKGHLMHLKECIIDDSVFIDGTFNWTNNAKNNVESINIYYNNEFNIEKTKLQYNEIKKQSTLLIRDEERHVDNSIVKSVGNKFGIFNTDTDEPILPAIYDEIREISDGYIFVKKGNDGGFLNEKLEFVIPLDKKYKYCGDFEKGGAINIIRNYYWHEGFNKYYNSKSLIDKEGKTILEFNTDYLPIKNNWWFIENKLIGLNYVTLLENPIIINNVIWIKHGNINGFFYFKNKEFIFLDEKTKEENILYKIENINYSIQSELNSFLNYEIVSFLCFSDKIDCLFFYNHHLKKIQKQELYNKAEFKATDKFIFVDKFTYIKYSELDRKLISKNILNLINEEKTTEIIISENLAFCLSKNSFYKIDLCKFKIINKIQFTETSIQDVSLFNSRFNITNFHSNQGYSIISKIFNLVSKDSRFYLFDEFLITYTRNIEAEKKAIANKIETEKRAIEENRRKMLTQIANNEKKEKTKASIIGVLCTFVGFFSFFLNGGVVGKIFFIFGILIIYRTHIEPKVKNIYIRSLGQFLIKIILFLYCGGLILLTLLHKLIIYIFNLIVS